MPNIDFFFIPSLSTQIIPSTGASILPVYPLVARLCWWRGTQTDQSLPAKCLFIVAHRSGNVPKVTRGILSQDTNGLKGVSTVVRDTNYQ